MAGCPREDYFGHWYQQLIADQRFHAAQKQKPLFFAQIYFRQKYKFREINLRRVILTAVSDFCFWSAPTCFAAASFYLRRRAAAFQASQVFRDSVRATAPTFLRFFWNFKINPCGLSGHFIGRFIFAKKSRASRKKSKKILFLTRSFASRF